MVCNDIPRDIPERDPPRTYVRTYVLCENRSPIQSLALMRSAIKSQHGPRTITLRVKYIEMLWEYFLIARKKKKRCPKFFPGTTFNYYAKHWVLQLYSAAAAPAIRVVAYICQCCRFGCFYHSVVFAEEQAFLFSSKESSAIAKKNILADQGVMSLSQELNSQNSTSWMRWKEFSPIFHGV